VHVIRFVVGTVRFTLNSTDGKFRVHVLLSFRVEDIPSGISRLTSQGREIPRFADQPPGALRRLQIIVKFILLEVFLDFLAMKNYFMEKSNSL